MPHIAIPLVLAIAAFAGNVASAGELPQQMDPPTARAPEPAAEKHAWLDLRVGLEGGGAPLLKSVNGPVAVTTVHTSASLFARVSVPVLTSRTVELGWIPRHGVAVLLQSAPFRLGPLRLRLLDLGAFYATDQPVTVSRVSRRWDLVVGSGAELSLTRRISLVVDARLFTPIDLWGVVSRYGETARLVTDELVHGVQLWAGASYGW